MSLKKQTETAMSIGQEANTEEAVKERTLWKRRRLFGNYALNQSKVQAEIVTDEWMDSKIFDARFYRNKIFHIINQDLSNSLNYQILGCIDPSSWHIVKASTALAAGIEGYETSIEPWAYYKIQVDNTVPASAALVEAYASGQT
jgi:hypothetical protein